MWALSKFLVGLVGGGVALQVSKTSCMDVEETCGDEKASICRYDGALNVPIQYLDCEYDPTYVYLIEQQKEEKVNFRAQAKEIKEAVKAVNATAFCAHDVETEDTTGASIPCPEGETWCPLDNKKYDELCESQCAGASDDARRICESTAHKYNLVVGGHEMLYWEKIFRDRAYDNYVCWTLKQLEVTR